MADNSIRILGAWGDDNIQNWQGGRSDMRVTEDYTVFYKMLLSFVHKIYIFVCLREYSN